MDNERLEALLKTNHKDAYLWALQNCRYLTQEAEEVLQNTYVKIYEGRAKFTNKSKFKTWLFAVIRYTAIDHMKSLKNYDELSNEIADQEKETSSVDFKKHLAQLPERQQQVLLLAFYHNMSLAEIADVTDLHIGTVRTHYERAKKALKKLIQNDYERI